MCLIAILSTLATSCIMYQPQGVDIPLINHENDLRIDGAVSAGYMVGIYPALNVTTSYGFNKWGAVQLHANWDFNRGYYLQAGVGAYMPIDKFVLEGYLGYGYGYKYYTKSDTAANAKEFFGSYQIPYLQLNAGWVGLANGVIDLGLGVKAGAYIPDITDRWTSQNETRYINQTTALIEPQAFFRVGGEHLKFTLRVGMCFFGEDSDLLYAPFGASLGVNYRF